MEPFPNFTFAFCNREAYISYGLDLNRFAQSQILKTDKKTFDIWGQISEWNVREEDKRFVKPGSNAVLGAVQIIIFLLVTFSFDRLYANR